MCSVYYLRVTEHVICKLANRAPLPWSRDPAGPIQEELHVLSLQAIIVIYKRGHNNYL